MKPFDAKVPHALKATQEWFGEIIGRPLNEKGGINRIAPNGSPIQEEARRHIAPSPTLKSFERLQIYNQQYWWRLLNNLHDVFPFLTRLFGYVDFNERIAIPYLCQYPPNHWSLNGLGKQLPSWIQENYLDEDQDLTYAAAILDEAYYSLFFKPLAPLIKPPEDPHDILTQALALQPHVLLFHHHSDLFSLRRNMLKEDPDYWLSHDFPELKKEETFTALMRVRKGNIARKTMTKAEYLILKQFQEGSSIESLSEWLESQPNEIQEAAETNLQKWFEEWTLKGMLMSKP